MDSPTVSNLLEHNSDGKYANSHLLHVKSGLASEEQLKDALQRTLDIAKKAGLPHNSKYIISVVANREGITYGYSYVWINNPEVYNLLVGKNKDGSERYEWDIDPDFVPDPTSKRWADIADMEDPPKIRIKLAPLLELAPYKLTPKQMAELQTRNCKGHLEVTQAFLNDPKPEYEHNVLCGTKIPIGITAGDLRMLFKQFVSDPNKKCTRKIKSVIITEDYPVVIMEENKAFIFFNPQSQDANFASKVCRKLQVKAKNNKEYTLLFHYAYKGKIPQL